MGGFQFSFGLSEVYARGEDALDHDEQEALLSIRDREVEDFLNSNVADSKVFTPFWSQAVTITNTVNYAEYQRVGKMITASFLLTATGAGTAGTRQAVDLPIAPDLGLPDRLCVGNWYYLDSGTANYAGALILNGGAGSKNCYLEASGATNEFGLDPPVTVAIGDKLSINVCYKGK